MYVYSGNLYTVVVVTIGYISVHNSCMASHDDVELKDSVAIEVCN